MISQRENPSEKRQCHPSLDDELAWSHTSTSPTDTSYDVQPQGDFVHPDKEESGHVGSADSLWVARPRNAFIIFRCEYVRRHSRMSRRARRTGAPVEKSLSKRAAEAWHQLSNEEKGHFKALAEDERREHARLYPYYRFRPVKRPRSKRSPHPRVVSVTNLLEQIFDEEAEREASPSPNARDVSVHNVPELASSLPRSLLSPCEFSPGVQACPLVRFQRDSTGHLPPPHMTPSVDYLSHPGMIRPLPTQSDFNSIIADDSFYLEDTLPPIPRPREHMNTCMSQLTMSASTTSSLANWDGKATDVVALHSHHFLESIPAYFRPEDTCDNIIAIGLDYDALFGYATDQSAHITVPCPPIYADPRVARTAYVCANDGT